MSREYEKQEALRMTHQNGAGNSNGTAQPAEPYINEIIPVDPSRTRRRPVEPDSRNGRWNEDYSLGYDWLSCWIQKLPRLLPSMDHWTLHSFSSRIPWEPCQVHCCYFHWLIRVAFFSFFWFQRGRFTPRNISPRTCKRNTILGYCTPGFFQFLEYLDIQDSINSEDMPSYIRKGTNWTRNLEVESKDTILGSSL